MSRSRIVRLTFLPILLAGAAAWADESAGRYDADGDGFLSRSELRSAAEDRGVTGDLDRRVSDVLDRYDEDRDDRLDRVEAGRLAADLRQRRPEGRRNPVSARGVLYVAGGDRRAQTLDVYAPAGARGAAVVVYVHGGGWSVGDKSQVGAKATYFNDLGYILVSVNYRLSPAVSHPRHVEDVAAALAWVHRNIADHGGDPARIGLLGHSAGAHLVALVATNPRFLAAHGLDRSILRGVVPVDFGHYDVAELVEVAPRFANVFPRDADGLRDASPIHHVAPDGGIPDFLFLLAGSGRDASSKARRMEAMRSTLEGAGIGAEIVEAPGKNHGSINQEIGLVDDAITKAVGRFFAARFGTVTLPEPK